MLADMYSLGRLRVFASVSVAVYFRCIIAYVHTYCLCAYQLGLTELIQKRRSRCLMAKDDIS